MIDPKKIIFMRKDGATSLSPKFGFRKFVIVTTQEGDVVTDILVPYKDALRKERG